MSENESLLGIMKKNVGHDLDKLVQKLGEIPRGSSSMDMGSLYYSPKQIETILNATPSIFPYYWSPKKMGDLTPEQRKICGDLNNSEQMGGSPISIFEVAGIVRKAQIYRL